jgi:hypothetical protein
VKRDACNADEEGDKREVVGENIPGQGPPRKRDVNNRAKNSIETEGQ